MEVLSHPVAPLITTYLATGCKRHLLVQKKIESSCANFWHLLDESGILCLSKLLNQKSGLKLIGTAMVG